MLRKLFSLTLVLLLSASVCACGKTPEKEEIVEIQPKIIKNFNDGVSSYSGSILMYDLDYQKPLIEKMQSLKQSETYTIDSPLVVYNPYETDYLSLYVYFENKQEVTLDYKIYSKQGEFLPLARSFKKDYSGNSLLNKKTEFQLTGLVKDKLNTIELKTYNKKGRFVKGVSFEFDTTNLSPYIPDDSEVKSADFDKLEKNGFYFVSGLYPWQEVPANPNYEQEHYFGATLLDIEGRCRSYIVSPLYKIDRPCVYKDKLIYTVSRGHLAFVNMKGEVENVVVMSRPTDNETISLHHDILVDGDNLILLANIEEDSIEEDDLFYKIDLTTYEKELMFRLSDLIDGIAAQTQWSHTNSMFIEERDNGTKDMYISTRYRSTVFKIEDIYNSPEISYMMSSTTFFDDYEIPKLRPVNIENEKNMIAGQHTVNVIRENIFEDRTLGKSQYYLSVFNNLAYVEFIENLCFEDFIDLEEIMNGEQSALQVYLIDEDKMTYEKVYDVRTKKSFAQGGAMLYYNRFIVSSCQGNTVYEIDFQGNILFELVAERKYRAYKILF